MSQSPFRPTLIPTLFTIPALAVLLALGFWQLQRLEWKESLIAERETQLAKPSVQIAMLEIGEAAALQFQRITVKGTFLHQGELFLGARAYQGVSGLEIMTPMRLDDDRVVMVNRGWVPLGKKYPAARPETLELSPVEISGIIRLAPSVRGWFTPENDTAANHWFFYDIEQMSRHLNLPLLPFVIEATAGPDTSRLPIGRTAKVDLRNNHLQYALTWFSLAVALIVIYVLYHRKRTQRPPNASPG